MFLLIEKRFFVVVLPSNLQYKKCCRFCCASLTKLTGWKCIFLSSTSLRPSAFLLPLTHFPSLSFTLWISVLSLSHTLDLSSPPQHPENSSSETEQQLHCHLKLFCFLLPDLFSCFLWMTVEARIARSKKPAPGDCMLSEKKAHGRERKSL